MVTYQRLNIAAHELLVVELSHAAQLWCEEGAVWLTHDLLRQDIELYRGEHLELMAGKILIEGRGQLCFCGENLHINSFSKSESTLALPEFLS